MKKIMAGLLCILSTNILSAAIAERDNVIITYEKANYPALFAHKPHQIEVRNNSDNKIIFDSSIIENPLLNQKEIKQLIWKNCSVSRAINQVIDSVLHGILDIFLAGLIDELIIGPINNKWIAARLVTLYHVCKPIEPFIKKLYVLQKSFQGSVELHPGASITKIVWLKNPKDTITINFDAIKAVN